MNRKKRETLKDAMVLLDRATSIVSRVLDEEQDCLDNMPENLESSERYSTTETAEKIEEAQDSIDDATT